MASDRPHLDPEPEKLRQAAATLRMLYGSDTGASVRLDRAAARIAALEAELAEAKAERDDYQAQHKELLVAAVHSKDRASAAEARAETMAEALQRIISHKTDHPNATVKRIVAISPRRPSCYCGDEAVTESPNLRWCSRRPG